MNAKTITPEQLAKLLSKGNHLLVDIREADEFARESIPGAKNVPMSELASCDCPEGATLVFHCKSGMRTQMAAPQLAEWAGRDILILDGGIEAWKRAGEKTSVDRKQPLEITRQVQITAGGLTLIGALASLYIAQPWAWLPVVTGAGLLLTGLTGNCLMARILMLMPWNRQAAA